MLKNKIINNLRNDIYCRIKRSKKQGVGVIAIKDIPKGTNPFKTLNQCKKKYIDIHKKDTKDIPKEVIKMLDDFVGSDDDEIYTIPIEGLNSINISYFMNHSNRPNIEIVNKKNDIVSFKSNKKIKKGAELTINYDKF